jgi:hypothetical protein
MSGIRQTGPVTLSYRGPLLRPAGVAAVEFNRMRRLAWEAVGEYWHEHFRAKHFTREGAVEYGYTPRSKRYEGRKKNYLRHARPLVYTGRSEERSHRRKYRIVSRGSRSELRIIIDAPQLNMRNPRSQVDMRKEMTTVSPRELRVLTRVFEETITRLLQGDQP